MRKRVKMTTMLLAISIFCASVVGCGEAPVSSSASSKESAAISSSEKESEQKSSVASSEVESEEDYGLEGPEEFLYKGVLLENGMDKAEVDALIGTGEENEASDGSFEVMFVTYGDDLEIVYSKNPFKGAGYTGGNFRMRSAECVSYRGISPGDDPSVISEKFTYVQEETSGGYSVYFEKGRNVPASSSTSDIRIKYEVTEGKISQIQIGISDAVIKKYM